MNCIYLGGVILNTLAHTLHVSEGSQWALHNATVVNANKRRSASSTLQVHGHGVSSTQAQRHDS